MALDTCAEALAGAWVCGQCGGWVEGDATYTNEFPVSWTSETLICQIRTIETCRHLLRERTSIRPARAGVPGMGDSGVHPGVLKPHTEALVQGNLARVLRERFTGEQSETN